MSTYVGSLFDIEAGRASSHVFLGSSRVSSVTDGRVHFVHSDHLGGANVITDIDGAVTAVIEYKPFGAFARNDRYVPGEDITPIFFTGQRFDQESELYYYNARYYDPELGRFITPDAMIPYFSDPQSFNRYSYTRNNPVNLVDPDGHFFWVAAIIGAVIGGAAGGISAHQSGGNVLAGIFVGAAGGAVMGAGGAWLGGLVQAGTIGLGTGIAGMAGIGAVTGAASSGILGGDVWQGALLGGLGGGLGFGLGGAFTSNFTKHFFTGGLAASAITGATVGGVGAELNGGSFGKGALSGAAWGSAGFLAGYGMSAAYVKYQAYKNSVRTTTTHYEKIEIIEGFDEGYRLDSLEDIINYGTELRSQGQHPKGGSQLFVENSKVLPAVTREEVLLIVDQNKMQVTRTLLNTGSKIVVKTTFDLTTTDVYKPINHTGPAVKGEGVIYGNVNIFNDPRVKSIDLFNMGQ